MIPLDLSLSAGTWQKVPKTKHIDEIPLPDQEEAKCLAIEIEAVWEVCGLRQDEESQTELAKAASLIKRLEEIGFRVVIQRQLVLPDYRLQVKVDLYTSKLKAKAA